MTSGPPKTLVQLALDYALLAFLLIILLAIIFYYAYTINTWFALHCLLLPCLYP
jgi:hypothetical protein